MDKRIEEQHRQVARLAASEHAADQAMARTVAGILPQAPCAETCTGVTGHAAHEHTSKRASSPCRLRS